MGSAYRAIEGKRMQAADQARNSVTSVAKPNDADARMAGLIAGVAAAGSDLQGYKNVGQVAAAGCADTKADAGANRALIEADYRKAYGDYINASGNTGDDQADRAFSRLTLRVKQAQGPR